MLKRTFEENIAKLIKIVEKDKIVGFIIVNILPNNPYVQLDYLAIFPEYQKRGYGSKAIKLLKKEYSDYNGIFIEIEKNGLGKDEEENKIRQKRTKFYENLGFSKINIDVEMYTVTYEIYIIWCSEIREDENKIKNYMFEMYNKILGTKKVEKYIKEI